MSKLLAMFPGQGSQYVGMGKNLLQEFPYTRVVFEEAEDAIRLSIRSLCFEGTEENLRLTANTQPCILTVSVAKFKVLEQETAWQPALFAGHSLGEYSALVAAGKLTLATAARLVRRRGEAMQSAVPAGIGSMAAVLSYDAEKLTALCQSLSRQDSLVEVVNFNSPQQQVIAGHKTAVEKVCSKLEEEKVRTVILPVSAPFHSSLMKPAREEMRPLIEGATFLSSNANIIANLTGKVEKNYDAQFLVDQISSAVLWTQTMQTAVAEGCDEFVEIGPGKVLVGLARRCVPKESRIKHTDPVSQYINN